MKKNSIRILLWSLVIIFIIITFTLFKNTFALFETEASGKANNDIGKWIIKINDELISDGIVETISVDQFVYEENEKVERGYIAPGTSAYFDLVFDATECDVAVKYDIEFLLEDMDYAENISITVNETGENSSIKTGPNTYSGVIDLDSIIDGDLITLRITINWANLEDYNESDTLLGTTEDSKLSVPIKVSAIQYLGEEIIPYVENDENDGESNLGG